MIVKHSDTPRFLKHRLILGLERWSALIMLAQLSSLRKRIKRSLANQTECTAIFLYMAVTTTRINGRINH